MYTARVVEPIVEKRLQFCLGFLPEVSKFLHQIQLFNSFHLINVKYFHSKTLKESERKTESNWLQFPSPPTDSFSSLVLPVTEHGWQVLKKITIRWITHSPFVQPIPDVLLV